jgi:hypothetical protein
MPATPQLALGGVVAVAAIGIVYWRAHRLDEPPGRATATATATAPGPQPHAEPPRPAPAVAVAQEISVPSADDVTADLIAEPARTTASYGQVIEELMTLSSTARTGWSDERSAAFDARVAALRDGIARAGQAHAEQRAQRALIRYLQGAVVRDDVLLASGGTR